MLRSCSQTHEMNLLFVVSNPFFFSGTRTVWPRHGRLYRFWSHRATSVAGSRGAYILYYIVIVHGVVSIARRSSTRGQVFEGIDLGLCSPFSHRPRTTCQMSNPARAYALENVSGCLKRARNADDFLASEFKA